jgi:hypothetical protein
LDLYLSAAAIAGTYSSAKLQDRLIKHYAGSIVIHTQRGQGISNLVFSDKLSLGDAIAAAGFCSFFGELFNRYLVMHPL